MQSKVASIAPPSISGQPLCAFLGLRVSILPCESDEICRSAFMELDETVLSCCEGHTLG